MALVDVLAQLLHHNLPSQPCTGALQLQDIRTFALLGAGEPLLRLGLRE